MSTNRFAELNAMVDVIHQANVDAGWWSDPLTGDRIDRNRGEMLMLAVTELAEAMEGVRKGINDDHLPNRSMEEVEIADCIIRLFDYCGGHGFDLAGAINEKCEYNRNRADHKLENRLKDGGKKL